MTIVQRTDLKKGDRIRLIRTGTVTHDPAPAVISKRITILLDGGERGTSHAVAPSIHDSDVIELLERPLPAEPPIGSVVLAATGVAYQRCASLPGAPGWQPTSHSSLSRTWLELNNHGALAPITVIHVGKPDA